MRRYLQERQELIRAAVPGTPPARRLARLTDEMIIGLAEGVAARELRRRTRWTLIALGGYGSGSLLPGSDLDLLIVSDARTATLQPFVEALLYPLWDAGLSVGHQVRTARQQLTATRTDITVLTASLTGRVLAGDPDLGINVLKTCAADAARRSGDVLAALHARPRPGSPYLLEPDLKDGAGGRRDFDELTWTAAVLTGAPQSDPSPLVSLGLLEHEQHACLRSAAEVVSAARWEMQREGAGSLMTEEVAAELRTDGSLVQAALADTHHLLLRTRLRSIGQGRAEDTPLSPAAFFDLAAGGEDARSGLEDAAWSGRLDHLVPGLSGLMTLRRPGIAHTLTVGAHSLACVTEAAEIVARARSGDLEDPVLAASARQIQDTRPLMVASLAHDVGKVEPGPGHEERGAGAGRAAATRFDLSDEQAADVARLVLHHLALTSAASNIDLDDPAEVESVARVLGDRELVAPLHVLSVADSRATGPGAWTAWHAALVGTLVSRLDTALSSDAAHARDVVRLFGHDRYEELVDRVVSDATPGAHALAVGNGPIPGSFRVTIAAADRPGLLATIAGTFALAGLDILAAHSAPTNSGVALDTFVVTSATLAPLGADTWTRLERLLSASLAGRLALSVRLGERRRHYPRNAGAPVEAVIDEDDHGAALRIRAPDRVGLLYDIARAVAESGLDVRSLTATSRAGWAEDVLRLGHVEQARAGALGQLAMRLREL